MVAAHAFRPFVAPQKGNCEITLNYFLHCVIMWLPHTFRNLDCSHDKKRLSGSHSHYWKDNIDMYILKM